MNKVSPESKALRKHLLRRRRDNARRNVIAQRGTSKSVLAFVDMKTDVLAEDFLKRIEHGEPLTLEMWNTAKLELETRICNSFYGGEQ